jgi:hypothetical protein
MGFVDDLARYLLRVQQGGVRGGVRLPEVDPSWVRGTVVQLFEALESLVPQKLSLTGFDEKFEFWMDGDFATLFADELAELLQESFLRGSSFEEVLQYVRLGIAIDIGLDKKFPSRARALELNRLVSIARESAHGRESWQNVPDYALEIRAVRRNKDELVLTPIGSVFLGLSGRDAIQWLLSVEVVQSTGITDSWRLSLETASALIEKPSLLEAFDYWEENVLPYSWSTLRRLSAMGLLDLVEDDPNVNASGYEGYTVLESGMRALKLLVGPGETPFSTLAATLSQDEALTALEAGVGRAVPMSGFNASAEAYARQARMVAHEIRNALLPAQSALDSLYGSMVGHEVETTVARLRPRIDSGLDRVLNFVRELLTTSELASQAAERFELARALDEARANAGGALKVQVTGPTAQLVEGFRGRFVLALVNILRNAEQAGARNMAIDAKLDEGGNDLLLAMDDDGPGVSAEQRERIFQRGVSLRGSTGEGLALVKEVIESEMKGKVACLEAPNGGARFLMRLPLGQRRSS